jgi:hypothetical protein
MQIHLGNARAFLHAFCVLIFLYSQPIECRGMHASIGALLSREASSRAVGHIAVLELSLARRWDSEPRDV